MLSLPDFSQRFIMSQILGSSSIKEFQYPPHLVFGGSIDFCFIQYTAVQSSSDFEMNDTERCNLMELSCSLPLLLLESALLTLWLQALLFLYLDANLSLQSDLSPASHYDRSSAVACFGLNMLLSRTPYVAPFSSINISISLFSSLPAASCSCLQGSSVSHRAPLMCATEIKVWTLVTWRYFKRWR